jgi:hypothetical protein
MKNAIGGKMKQIVPKTIKLCYEELEQHILKPTSKGLALYKGVPHFKTGIPSNKYFEIKGYYEENKCEWCNEEVLHRISIKKCYCSNKCKNKHKDWNNEKKTKSQKLKSAAIIAKHKKDIYIKKLNKKHKTDRYWKIMEKGKMHVLYNRYVDLGIYYDICQASYDKDILNVRCVYCNEWFEPNFNQVRKIRSFINGTNSKKHSTTFYCCNEHAIKFKNKLTKIKKEWKLSKQIEITDIELLLIPEIIEKQKYFKKLGKIDKTNEYMRKIKGTYRIYKMPIEPSKRKDYIIKQNKKNLKKLKTKNPKEFKIRRLLYYSRVRSKQKNLEHNITKEWLYEKMKENKCELTGIEYDYDAFKPRNPYGPSIDRVDVSKGYTPDNCRVVIWAVNAGLGHYSECDLYMVCKSYLDFNKVSLQ